MYLYFAARCEVTCPAATVVSKRLLPGFESVFFFSPVGPPCSSTVFGFPVLRLISLFRVLVCGVNARALARQEQRPVLVPRCP